MYKNTVKNNPVMKKLITFEVKYETNLGTGFYS